MMFRAWDVVAASANAALKLEEEKPISRSELEKLKKELKEKDRALGNQEERLRAVEKMLQDVALAKETQVESYRLSDSRAGRVVVFANTNFQKLPKRFGTDADVAQLRTTFGGLGYKVVVNEDSTTEEMKLGLQDIAEGAQQSIFGSCIVIFLSHGSAKGVMGVDSVPLPDSEIYNPLGRSSKLQGKPKIVLLDACQGRQQQGTTEPWHDNDADPEDNLSAEESARTSDPIGLDLMVVKSTVPQHVSKSHETKGSLFIMELCRVLGENARNTHFEDIIKLVARRMVAAAKEEGFEACSSVRLNGLTKRFFLVPQK